MTHMSATAALAAAAALVACQAQPLPAGSTSSDDAAVRAAPAAAPQQRTFRDWTASCDNGGDCVAFAGPAAIPTRSQPS